MRNLLNLFLFTTVLVFTADLYGQSETRLEAPYVQSVIIANIGSTTSIGDFEEVTYHLWESQIGDQTNSYEELNRDQWSIYLQDKKTEETVVINLWTKKVLFSGAEKYLVLESGADAIPDEDITKEETGVITNVALGKSARQSSDYSAGPGKTFPAGLAVDGVKSGFGKLSHTLQEYGAWWEVDLGRPYNISSIKVYNATDHPQRMNDFTILVSETPFTGNSGGTVFVANEAAPKPTKSYTGNARGRYVRLFLNETNYLTIHEIEVFGSIGGEVAPPSVVTTTTPTTTVPPPTTTAAPTAKEVKFYSKNGLTLTEARDIAAQNGWKLATSDEVSAAFQQRNLDVYAFGMMADGRFAVPVQSNHSNFKRGANIGAVGGNQGFLYTVVTNPTTSSPTVNTSSTNTTGTPPKSNRDAINSFIRKDLNYNASELLSVKADGSSEAMPSNSRDKVGNAVIICTYEQKKADESLRNISLVNPSNTIFPGALVYGDRSLAEGKPRSIGIERAPITLTLMLPGAYGESGSKRIDKPVLSEIQSARNELIENWFKNNPGEKDYKNFAKQTLTTTRVFNSDQASLKLGFNAKWAQGNADVSAAMNIDTEKEVTVAIFKQIFYTVACDKPTTPADFFAPSVSLGQVKEVINSNEPPAYVKSVDYGRTLMIRMETDKLAAGGDLEAAFNYAAGPDSEVGGSIDATYQKVLENSTFRLYALGGNAQTPAGIIDGTDLKKLRDVIYNDALFRRDNPGAPMSYTVNYLKGDVTASVYSSANYVEKTCTEYPNGQIILKHGGGYVGRFIVTWEIDGKQCPECKFESGKVGNGWKETVPVPADAKNVVIKGDYGGIGYDNWQEVIYQVESGPTNCTYLIRGSAITRFGQKINPDGEVVKTYN